MSLIAPYDIMPAGLIDASKRAQAIAWIRQSPHPSTFRRGLLAGWAAAVGLTLTADDYLQVGYGTYPFRVAAPGDELSDT